MQATASAGKDPAARLVGCAFAVGLGASLLLALRGQLGGDQLNLLARGWLLAERGQWIPFGNPMSTGGYTPGGLTSLLVGLPLLLWRHFRAPSLLVVLCHALSWWLLDGVVKRTLAPRERLLFAVVYGLSPWRLYFSGFLWNPNYLFLAGAVHLWSTYVQRDRARFFPSLAHVAALGLALQLHPSTVLLVAASGVLWLRGFWRFHPAGVAAGIAIASLPLLPWLAAVSSRPELVTEADGGFPFRGLVLVFPLIRGLAYWLRYPSLFLAEKVTRFDFSGVLGTDPWLGRGLTFVANGLLPATVLVPLVANGRVLLRRGWRRLLSRPTASPGGRRWLQGYAGSCLAGAIAIFALAPSTPMYWQVVPLFHAAVLPVVLWAGALARTRWRGRVRVALGLWAGLSLLLTAAIAFGSPQYRCGGRQDLRFPLDSHSPMFDELGIQSTCPWPLDRPDTWWPDVLPRAESSDPGPGTP